MRYKLFQLVPLLLILWVNNVYPNNATSITIQKNKSVAIPLDNEFANSRRGFIANESATSPLSIDINQFKFESGINPNEVNPSLWQHARLNNVKGLFKVTDSIYQIRGFDMANMSIIEGKTGIILIDPLSTAQVAHGALQLYYAYRPKKPVIAVIYSHSHIDHFGGVKGVVSIDDVKKHKVQIIAPFGFSKEAVEENVYAGNAMSLRSEYMFGAALKPGPTGFVENGLGQSFVIYKGTVTLIPPTKEITTTNSTLTIDGVKLVFQLTPGTEAPSEMNIFLPQFHALAISENSSKTLHNFLTLRGAQVRNSKDWAKYLDETIDKFGVSTQVMFAQHQWPTWGNKEVIEQLSNQRDEILYIHDQALRMTNMGYTPGEIAESIHLPEELNKYGYDRGYYGTLKHNAKAVYQKYLGFYDGNPANLDPLPEVAAAKKYVEYMGGSQEVIRRAQADYKKGNYRWVVTVMNQVVFAEPLNKYARELEADAMEQLAYQAEAATWRNEYLSAAQELRHKPDLSKKSATTLSPDVLAALTVSQFIDNLSIHLNPQKVKNITLVSNWIFPDTKQKYTIILHNSVIRYKPILSGNPDFSVTVNKAKFFSIMSGVIPFSDTINGITLTGDKTKFKQFTGYFDKFAAFNIIEP